MTTIIDREICRLMRADLDAALKPVAEKYGIDLKVGRMTYSPKTVAIKLEGGAVGENGEANDKYTEAWKHYARLWGLPEDGLGRKFRNAHGEYTICGLNPAARRMPVLAKRDGKTYKFEVSVIARYLGTGSPPRPSALFVEAPPRQDNG